MTADRQRVKVVLELGAPANLPARIGSMRWTVDHANGKSYAASRPISAPSAAALLSDDGRAPRETLLSLSFICHAYEGKMVSVKLIGAPGGAGGSRGGWQQLATAALDLGALLPPRDAEPQDGADEPAAALSLAGSSNRYMDPGDAADDSGSEVYTTASAAADAVADASARPDQALASRQTHATRRVRLEWRATEPECKVLQQEALVSLVPLGGGGRAGRVLSSVLARIAGGGSAASPKHERKPEGSPRQRSHALWGGSVTQQGPQAPLAAPLPQLRPLRDEPTSSSPGRTTLRPGLEASGRLPSFEPWASDAPGAQAQAPRAAQLDPVPGSPASHAAGSSTSPSPFSTPLQAPHAGMLRRSTHYGDSPATGDAAPNAVAGGGSMAGDGRSGGSAMPTAMPVGAMLVPGSSPPPAPAALLGAQPESDSPAEAEPEGAAAAAAAASCKADFLALLVATLRSEGSAEIVEGEKGMLTAAAASLPRAPSAADLVAFAAAAGLPLQAVEEVAATTGLGGGSRSSSAHPSPPRTRGDGHTGPPPQQQQQRQQQQQQQQQEQQEDEQLKAQPNEAASLSCGQANPGMDVETSAAASTPMIASCTPRLGNTELALPLQLRAELQPQESCSAASDRDNAAQHEVSSCASAHPTSTTAALQPSVPQQPPPVAAATAQVPLACRRRASSSERADTSRLAKVLSRSSPGRGMPAAAVLPHVSSATMPWHGGVSGSAGSDGAWWAMPAALPPALAPPGLSSTLLRLAAGAAWALCSLTGAAGGAAVRILTAGDAPARLFAQRAGAAPSARGGGVAAAGAALHGRVAHPKSNSATTGSGSMLTIRHKAGMHNESQGNSQSAAAPRLATEQGQRPHPATAGPGAAPPRGPRTLASAAAAQQGAAASLALLMLLPQTLAGAFLQLVLRSLTPVAWVLRGRAAPMQSTSDTRSPHAPAERSHTPSASAPTGGRSDGPGHLSGGCSDGPGHLRVPPARGWWAWMAAQPAPTWGAAAVPGRAQLLARAWLPRWGAPRAVVSSRPSVAAASGAAQRPRGGRGAGAGPNLPAARPVRRPGAPAMLCAAMAAPALWWWAVLTATLEAGADTAARLIKLVVWWALLPWRLGGAVALLPVRAVACVWSWLPGVRGWARWPGGARVRAHTRGGAARRG